MTAQEVDTQPVSQPASPYCPKCGEPVFPEVAEDFADGAVRGQRQLFRRVVDAHDREQESLAYEIHETLVQPMIGALLRFQAVEQLLRRDANGKADELRAICRALYGSIDEARRIANRLRPPILDEFGIVAGINYLTAEITRHAELEIEFSHDGKPPRMPPAVETAAFRIAEQLLSNVSRHSQTRRVRVEVAQTEGSFHLEVRDWGVGFDPAAVRDDRLGLQQVRQRAKLLGGRTTVDSAPGDGTRVVVDLPTAGSELSDG